MSIEQLLRDEIQTELEKLKELEVGTDEHKAMVDSVTKLTDRVIELEKIDVDEEDREAKREEAKKQAEFEQQTKLKEMDDEGKDRLIRNCIAAAGIVVPVLVTIWGTKKSFEFEKEGTITTIMGRGFINKLLPRK